MAITVYQSYSFIIMFVGVSPLFRSHDKRGNPKAVKFSNTVTEFPDYSRFDEETTSSSGGSRTSKSSGHKYTSGHSGSSPGHSPGHQAHHSVLGHGSGSSGGGPIGQYNDRTVPDGESGHSKNDITRKSSNEK